MVDASISHYSVKSDYYTTNIFGVPPLTQPVGVKKSQTALANSGYNSSRIGFRGTEDLGGGLKANFALTGFFRPDTGQSGRKPFRL